MLDIIITLDYELPAGGKGNVRKHMLEPTATLLDVCEGHKAKLTIMAEIGELWAFEKSENAGYQEHLRYDPAVEIKNQLFEAIKRGHDVQLHLHPHWINAKWNKTCWHLDYSHYHLTDFSHDQIISILQRGKNDLMTLLRPYRPSYECVGFRAGHWNTQPSDRYLTALRKAGLKSDTSVFKWGVAHNIAVSFDYSNAFSNFRAWYTNMDDINFPSSKKEILEIPITTEPVKYITLLTPRRLWKARKFYREDREISDALCIAKRTSRPSKISDKLMKLFTLHPKKLDFCKLTSREMLSMVNNLIEQCQKISDPFPIPIVMIGHSKQVRMGKELGIFLESVRKRFTDNIRFSTLQAFVSEYEAVNDKLLNNHD